MNSSPLPFTRSQVGANKQEIISSILTFGASLYSDSVTVRSTTNGQVTTQAILDAGTYTSGGTYKSSRFVTFLSTANGSTSEGAFGDVILARGVDGVTYIYRKQ